MCNVICKYDVTGTLGSNVRAFDLKRVPSSVPLKMATSERTEVRAVVKFLAELGRTPTQTYEMMRTTSLNSHVSRSLVFRWHKRFKDGQDDLKDERGRGRQRDIATSSLTTSIREAVMEDRRLTVRTLAQRFDVGNGTVHRILKDELLMSKVSIQIYTFSTLT